MLVDNSGSVLESFKWILKGEPYYLFAFDNPFDAMDILDKIKFAVVVAEQSLPEMDGLEFLKRVKAISPETAGIIMTAYLESAMAINAIRQGFVLFFLKKPWEAGKVIQAIELAAAHYDINAASRRLRPS